MPKLIAALLACLFPTLALAQEPSPRAAAEILREFHRVEMPTMSDGNSPEAVARFRKAIDDGCRRKAQLALELYRGHPAHDQAASVLATRWAGMTNALGEGLKVLREIRGLLKSEKRDDIRKEALFAAVRAALTVPEIDAASRRSLVDRAFKSHPDDSRCGHAYAELATDHTVDPEEMGRLADLVLKHWSEDAWCKAPARGVKKLLARIGKRMEIELDDIRGKDSIPTIDPAKSIISRCGSDTSAETGDAAGVNRLATLNKRPTASTKPTISPSTYPVRPSPREKKATVAAILTGN